MLFSDVRLPCTCTFCSLRNPIGAIKSEFIQVHHKHVLVNKIYNYYHVYVL